MATADLWEEPPLLPGHEGNDGDEDQLSQHVDSLPVPQPLLVSRPRGCSQRDTFVSLPRRQVRWYEERRPLPADDNRLGTRMMGVSLT